MTSKTRRTEIHIETHEIKIIRFRGGQSSVHCERCNAMVSALLPEQAAELLRITQDDIFLNLAEERFHLVGTTRGLALVCGNSLDNKNKAMVLKASPNQM